MAIPVELRRRLADFMRAQVLTLDNFTLTTNTTNTESCIMEYQVPQNVVLYIPRDAIYDMRIVTKETFELEAEESRTSYTATLSYRIIDEPSLPMDGGDCVAYWYPSGGSNALTEVTDIDYTAGTVTATVTASAGTLTLYYILGNGYITWYIEPPLGYEVVRKLVLNESLAVLHSHSHIDENSINRVPDHIWIPPKHKLRIYLNSSATVSWDDEATNKNFRLHCWTIDRSGLRETDLIAIANEIKMRK